MTKPEVLVVEDERNVRELITDVLAARDIDVRTCSSINDADGLVRQRQPDALVLDVKLPDGDGLRFLETLQSSGIHIPTVVLTAFGTVDRAVQAMRAGARDFVVKPFDNERLASSVRSAIAATQQIADVGMTAGLVGSTSGLKELVTLLPRIAGSDCTVLIRGESGTGKEMIARALHAASARADGPFVAVNCAALPSTLLESELFGYERGSFTGAHARKKGIIESAEGGTLFLDEIGDMPLEAQSRLLRVLQERELVRIGSTAAVKVDVRVVAATHRDLRDMSRRGTFREDLLFRLAVVPVEVPPLRARTQDIPGLVEHFIAKHGGATAPRPGRTFLEVARRHPWPGNVRELENCVQRALVLGTFEPQTLLGATAAPAPIEPPRLSANVRTLRDAVAAAERDAVLAALRATEGNKAEAARLLGISYKTLFNKLHEHDIREDARFE